MRWPAPAKLNLFLRVTGRRADGRHDLQTVFQLLDFGDEVEIVPRRDTGIVLLDPPPGLEPGNELSVRAAELLRARAPGAARRGVSIRLVKRIPQGAGLGGGSSNAATTPRGPQPDLGGRARRRSARRPRSRARRGRAGVRARPERMGGGGRGTAPPAPAPAPVVPRGPSSGLRLDRRGLRRSRFDTGFPSAQNAPPLPRGRGVDVAALLAAAGNDCEPLVRLRNPVVGNVIEWLRRRVEREEWARMTGTGSAAFGVFREEGPARRAIRELPEGWDGWVARGIAESPLHAAGRHGPASGSPAGEGSG